MSCLELGLCLIVGAYAIMHYVSIKSILVLEAKAEVAERQAAPQATPKPRGTPERWEGTIAFVPRISAFTSDADASKLICELPDGRVVETLVDTWHLRAAYDKGDRVYGDRDEELFTVKGKLPKGV